MLPFRLRFADGLRGEMWTLRNSTDDCFLFQTRKISSFAAVMITRYCSHHWKIDNEYFLIASEEYTLDYDELMSKTA